MEYPENQQHGSLLSRNIVWLTAATVIASVCVFVVNWAVIFWYGSTQHGRFVWVLAASRFGMVLTDLGLVSKSGVRTIARLRAREPSRLGPTISSLVTLELLSGSIVTMGLFVAAGPIGASRAAGGAQMVTALHLAATWIILEAMTRTCAMIATGFERARLVMLMTPLGRGLQLVSVLFCALVGLDLTWIFVAWTGSYAVALLTATVAVCRLARRTGLHVRLTLGGLHRAARILRDALPYYLPFVGLVGVPFFLQIFVGTLASRETISIVQVCWSLAAVSRLLAGPISRAVFPQVSRMHAAAGVGEQTGQMLVRLSRLLGLGGSFVLAAYWTAGRPLLAALYPTQAYARAWATLLLLAGGMAVENYALQLNQVLMAVGRVGAVAVAEALKYAMLAGGMYVAVAWLGASGVGVVFLAVSCLNAGAKMALTRRYVPQIGAKPFAAAAVTMALLTAVAMLPHGRWTCLGVWVLATWALGLLRPAEVRKWGRFVLCTLWPRDAREP